MTTNTEIKAKTVLIVEDNPMLQVGLRHALSAQPGLKVIGQVEDGLQAVSTAVQLKPDIALVDIELPGMDGITLTQRIKDVLPDTRIIIFTHYTNPTKVMAALSSGANGYCVKGVSIPQLEAAIMAIGEGNWYLDAKIADCVLQNIRQPLPDGEELEEVRLTEREMQVLQQLVEGKSNTEIGLELGVSANTIKGHVQQIIHKLKASDRTQAAVKALRLGLV
ncbi:response regulator transcription factor [Phormidium sp. LEGE 05292]|uniref:response regulator n=1 Tax=[Phormidium] sp. LEGE 05292 TaxID=767427 RepID=UPI001882BF58|nr:response regulator transcription factor [Phormidium sp. LEGE 05292]MBE9224141.1 response regulator transcription factor [Phormidium sp. LEGE 05292]